MERRAIGSAAEIRSIVTAEDRFRTEVRLILERCRALANGREVHVRSAGARLVVTSQVTDEAIAAFIDRTRPDYVHITNLGRPGEAERIKWIRLRFSTFRRVLHTITNMICMLLPASELKNGLYRMIGMRIGEGVEIAQGAFLDPFSPRLITIGDGTVLGAFAKVFTHAYRGQGRMLFGPVVVGRDCMISGTATVGPCVLEDRVTILPGVVAMPFLHLKVGTVVGLRVQFQEQREEIAELTE
jgi:hypothetical protein